MAMSLCWLTPHAARVARPLTTPKSRRRFHRQRELSTTRTHPPSSRFISRQMGRRSPSMWSGGVGHVTYKAINAQLQQVPAAIAQAGSAAVVVAVALLAHLRWRHRLMVSAWLLFVITISGCVT